MTDSGETQPGGGKAIASLVLGIISLITWIIPLIGFPVSITGLVLGFKGRKSSNEGLALAGIIICIITLIFTTINSAIGAYLGATGQL